MDKALVEDFEALYSIEWNDLGGVYSNRIKLIIRNPGLLQSWHIGAGGKSFFFIDEITID